MSALAVFSPRRFARLITSDAMNVSRDPMLIFGTLMSLLPGIGLWMTRGMIDASALSAFGVASFSTYIVPVALLLPAFLIGWVTGFLLLEDRDDGPLMAVDVTPVGKTGFLAYRIAVTMVLVAAITAMALGLLLPGLDWLLWLVLMITIPADAALSALILVALARNKVEGLALTKVTNLAAIGPLLALLPMPWRVIGWILPTYWIGELLRLDPASPIPTWLAIVLTVAVHAAAAGVTLRVLDSRAG